MFARSSAFVPERPLKIVSLALLMLSFAACRGKDINAPVAGGGGSGGGAAALLAVDEPQALSASWSEGEAIPGKTVVYTLTNQGAADLVWLASVDAPWVGLSTAAGRLASKGSTQVAVSLTGEARKLATGAFQAKVDFTNVTNGKGTTSRLVSAVVRPAESVYKKWVNGPSPRKDWFPLGVFVQDPALAPKFKALGINTYVGLPWRAREQDLATLRNAGINLIAWQNRVCLTSGHNVVVKGWRHTDEPDTAKLNDHKSYDEPIDPAIIETQYRAFRAKDGTRPVFLNLGPGVAYEDWFRRGLRVGKLEDYPLYLRGTDIASFRYFPVSDPPSAQLFGQLGFVARGVERLVGWARGKPVWNVIETVRTIGKARATPAQIRAMVFMSLASGSRGIVWNVTESKPARRAAIFRYPETVAAVTAINAEVKALAPVLNSRSLDIATAKADHPRVPIAIAAKKHDGAVYLITASLCDHVTAATITVEDLPDGSKVEALGEKRSFDLKGGAFRDSYDVFGVHVYKITRP